MKVEYKSEVYNATKTFLIIGLLFMLVVILLIIIGRLSSSPIIPVVGFMCLCIVPFVFEQKLKSLFTKRVLIEFSDLSFSITQYNTRGDIGSNQININWSEVKSYRFYFSPAKNTILTLVLRNGLKKQWAFKDNKNSQEAIGGESLFSFFYVYIKQYNVGKCNDERIDLSKGFFNSTIGVVVLYFEVVIMILGFILHIIMHPQSSFATLLIGFGLVIQQISKKKQEKALYDTISNL